MQDMLFNKDPKNRYESRIILGIIAVLLILVSLPSIYGYIVAPEGEKFTGIRSYVPGDIFVYYSYIEQVKQGGHILENLYTTEYGRPFVNVFWQSAGYVGKVLLIEPDIVFFVLRIVLGAVFLYTIYFLLKTFRFDYNSSIIPQYLFIILFGGLGAYYLVFNFNADEYTTTLDLWTPEHNYITALIASPHFIFSFTLIAVLMYLGYKTITERRAIFSVYGGIVGLILFQFHPYYTPLIFFVWGAYYIVHAFYHKDFQVFQGIKLFLPLVILSAPSIVYHVYLLWVDEVFIARAIENILPMPPLFVFLLGYGLYLPLSLFGLYIFSKKKERSNKELFIATWFIVQGLLLFMPISYQRKLIAGWTTPMAILAWEGGRWLVNYVELNWLKKKFSVPLIFALFVILTPTTFYNLVRDISLYNSDTSVAQEHGILWLTTERQEAYAWLEENTTTEEPILGHLDSSVTIPAFAGRRVYAGHWSETIYSMNSKRLYIAAFFKPSTDDMWRGKFLEQRGIKYLWWGSQEKRFFGDFKPDEKSFLKKRFENNEIAIYQVVQ